MSLITKTANVALFAVAALPFIALAAARAEPVTVHVSDLNMSKPAHVQEFNRRLDRATDQICGDTRQIGQHEACVTAVRSEANDKMSQRKVASR